MVLGNPRFRQGCGGNGERFCHTRSGYGRWQEKGKRTESFRFAARWRSWGRGSRTRFRRADSVRRPPKPCFQTVRDKKLGTVRPRVASPGSHTAAKWNRNLEVGME